MGIQEHTDLDEFFARSDVILAVGFESRNLGFRDSFRAEKTHNRAPILRVRVVLPDAPLMSSDGHQTEDDQGDVSQISRPG